jgi:hypothetical protein
VRRQNSRQARRERLRRRASGRCEYCRSPEHFCPDPFCEEHIHPQSGGGLSKDENLAWSCFGCNGAKAAAIVARDPESGEIVPLYNPRMENWGDHFVWSVDLCSVIGVTPTGRATANRLRLNRPELQNLRRVLATIGEHPP